MVNEVLRSSVSAETLRQIFGKASAEKGTRQARKVPAEAPQVVSGRGYSLGGFRTWKQASHAYKTARLRARLGEPISPKTREATSAADIARWYQPPSKVYFGEESGELVVHAESNQEHSVLITHRALSRLHPGVRKFILVAADTGDLSEAPDAAGLDQNQIATILPQLRIFLGPILH